MERSTLTVLYNADCPICAREVAGYARLAARSGAAAAFLPIAAADLGRWGLTPETAAQRLHAVEEGRVLGGLAAFRALWARLPGLGWLAWLTGLPVVAPLAGLVYDRILAPLLYAFHRRRVRRRACTAERCG